MDVGWMTRDRIDSIFFGSVIAFPSHLSMVSWFYFRSLEIVRCIMT